MLVSTYFFFKFLLRRYLISNLFQSTNLLAGVPKIVNENKNKKGIVQKVHLLWHIIYSWKEPLLIETDMIVPWDIAESDLFFKVMKARARE